MNKSILDNPSKQKLLVTFCEQPARFFSVRELVLRTSLSENKIKSLLSFFSKHRLINIAEKKKQKYFQINTSSSAFIEISKIFKPTKKDLARDIVTKAVAASGQIKFAALTGVFVGQTSGEVDLLLVGRTGQKRLEKTLKFLRKLAGHEINYAAISTKEFLDRFYSFDWFIKEIMDRSPAIIIDEISKNSEKQKISKDMVKMVS